MKKLIKISVLIILLCVLTGCNNLKKCRPQVDPFTGYVGISCSGEF